MVYSISMRYLLLLVVVVLFSGCTIHLKATELEMDSKPVEPGVKWSSQVYELESIDILKKEI